MSTGITSGTGWRTSSFCGAYGSCVEVAIEPGLVLVRSTEHATPALVFTHQEWAGFLAGVRNHEFDLPA